MPMLLMVESAVGLGLQTLGLGMLMVLGIIALLYIVLKLLIPIFSAISAKKEKTADTGSPAPAVSPVTAPSDDEGKTVAAIIAAIAAYEGKSPENFRVVSFKKRF